MQLRRRVRLERLLAELRQLLFRLRMVGMLLQEFQKDPAGFLAITQNRINTRQVEIGLIISRRHAD